MISLTHHQFLNLNPSESVREMVTRQLPDWADRAIGFEEAAARGVKLDHLLWVAERLGHSERLVAFAVDCAERALPKFEATFPDDHRPREAINAARSTTEAEKIREAAVNAAEAFDAAYIAAGDAPATWAAKAAQYAGWVAWVIALPSDGDSVIVDTFAATSAAANAADDGDAERAWQRDHFVEVFK